MFDEAAQPNENEDKRVSSSKSKRIRVDDEVKKEMINEFRSEPLVEVTRAEKAKRHDDLYASLLPSSDYYQRSFMHRDVVTHVLVTPTDFLISASQDGHIKFWKILTADYLKEQQTKSRSELSKANDDDEQQATNSFFDCPIEFVKHFRAHLG